MEFFKKPIYLLFAMRVIAKAQISDAEKEGSLFSLITVILPKTTNSLDQPPHTQSRCGCY